MIYSGTDKLSVHNAKTMPWIRQQRATAKRPEQARHGMALFVKHFAGYTEKKNALGWGHNVVAGLL